MIEIRLHGEPDAVQAALCVLRNEFVITSKRGPYSDHRPSTRVRLYLRADLRPGWEEADPTDEAGEGGRHRHRRRGAPRRSSLETARGDGGAE